MYMAAVLADTSAPSVPSAPIADKGWRPFAAGNPAFQSLEAAEIDFFGFHFVPPSFMKSKIIPSPSLCLELNAVLGLILDESSTLLTPLTV
ncbi:hypothetical protein QKW52_11025 [Bacillus sonorensis]|nr:hypothetical protein [Bacillus sonorensis]